VKLVTILAAQVPDTVHLITTSECVLTVTKLTCLVTDCDL